MVDLFDGNLQGQKVQFLESVEGKAVDYDFTRDVGLIRIRPGRRLPASRVVPATWEPKSRMGVLTVGCSEGKDATIWNTVINRSRIQNFLSGNPSYEAVECDVAPKQGRSGGGLYTQDGYLMGVCNFAEPQGNHGLYATPRSIYYLLDRNRLTAVYAPVKRPPASALADRRAGSQPRRGDPISVARSQSPDSDEPARDRPRTHDEDVLVPAPSLLGIADPVDSMDKLAPQAASGTTRRTAWHRAQSASVSSRPERKQQPDAPDTNRDTPTDPARPAPSDGLPETMNDDSDLHDPLPRSMPTVPGYRWRAVKVTPVKEGRANADN